MTLPTVDNLSESYVTSNTGITQDPSHPLHELYFVAKITNEPISQEYFPLNLRQAAQREVRND